MAYVGKSIGMDWDDLRIFLAVARTDSLSGAGKRLKIDPARDPAMTSPAPTICWAAGVNAQTA